MTQENRDTFLKHALEQQPREACALLVRGGEREILVICENKSVLDDQFEISARDHVRAMRLGEVVGVVHSHVLTPPQPSDADLVSCGATGLPWHIVSVPTGHWYSFTPNGFKAPLIGRHFAYGILDCYTLVRDYYREKLEVEIKDFDHGDFGWWDQGEAKFNLDNCKEAGFFEVGISEIREHDVCLMQIMGQEINHVAVYIGNDMILHHLNRRLSAREIFAGYYRRHTVRVMRYGGKR